MTIVALEALFKRRQEEERRADRRIGRICATIINANPFRGEGAETVSELDFMPKESSEEQSPEDQARVLNGLIASQGQKQEK